MEIFSFARVTAIRLSGVVAAVVMAAGVAMPTPGPWTVLLVVLASLSLGLCPLGIRQGVVAIGLGVLGTCVLVLAGVQDWREGARELLFCSTWVGLPWLAGLAWRLRRQVHRQAKARVVQERREHRARQRHQQDTERLALAESLHDDLGHALSLVALNLGRMELADHLALDAQETVTMARRQLSGAVERLGASVSMLREGAVPPRPQLGEDETTGLIETARASGAEVQVIGPVTLDQLSSYGRASVGRVVKEALTNAIKHAPGQPMTITLEEQEGHLRLSMDNPVHVRVIESSARGGSGLEALSNHLRTVGGTLNVTGSADHFSVEAVIPMLAHSAETVDDDADLVGREGNPVAVARRKGWLILAGVVVVAVVILGTVEAFSRFETGRALLPTAAFVRIKVGDTREQIERYVPEQELLPRPQTSAGFDCHDYSVTSDWLSDASGDVHRICFTDGVVTRTERLVGRVDK